MAKEIWSSKKLSREELFLRNLKALMRQQTRRNTEKMFFQPLNLMTISYLCNTTQWLKMQSKVLAETFNL